MDMARFQVKHGDKSWSVNTDGESGGIYVDGKPMAAEVTEVTEHYRKITLNGVVHHVLFESFDKTEKKIILRVNGERKEFSVKDRNDEQLAQFGIQAFPTPKVNELKSPMPGLVLKIEANPGDVLQKGDPILVLEAMKMENVLKAPADVKVKEVLVKSGQAVEKNAVLVKFQS